MRAARRCSGCGRDLRAHEAAEGICDGCLRATQITPLLKPEEPVSFEPIEALTENVEEAMPEEPSSNGHADDDQIVRDLLEGVDW